MLLLARNNKSTINYLGISQYLSENYKHVTYACCDQNITNEIKYTEPGTIYTFENNSFKVDKYFEICDELFNENEKNVSFVVPIQMMAHEVNFHSVSVQHSRWLEIDTFEDFETYFIWKSGIRRLI